MENLEPEASQCKSDDLIFIRAEEHRGVRGVKAQFSLFLWVKTGIKQLTPPQRNSGT